MKKMFYFIKSISNSDIRNTYIKRLVKYELPEELFPQKRLMQLTKTGKLRFTGFTVAQLLNKNNKYSLKYYKNILIHANHMKLNEYLLKEYICYSYLEQKPIFEPVKDDNNEYLHVHKESNELASIYCLVTKVKLNKSIYSIINKLNKHNYSANLIMHSHNHIYHKNKLRLSVYSTFNLTSIYLIQL